MHFQGSLVPDRENIPRSRFGKTVIPSQARMIQLLLSSPLEVAGCRVPLRYSPAEIPIQRYRLKLRRIVYCATSHPVVIALCSAAAGTESQRASCQTGSLN